MKRLKMMLYKKNVNTNNTNDSRSIIYNAIRSESTVLDMGCACGDLAEKLKKEKNCKIFGLEYNKESVEKCVKKNVFESVLQFDLNELSYTSFPEFVGKFDYIIFGDILEHLLSPKDILKISLKYLKTSSDGVISGGKLLISLPNLGHASIKTNLLLNDFTRTPLGILDNTHLHFFTCHNIAEFLAEIGLDIENIFYTTLPFDGYQPHKISELPVEIADFITNDPHSKIFQYVLLCVPCPSVSKHMLDIKLTSLKVDISRPTLVFKIKRFIMNQCPQIIKYVEKFR